LFFLLNTKFDGQLTIFVLNLLSESLEHVKKLRQELSTLGMRKVPDRQINASNDGKPDVKLMSWLD